MLHSRFLPVILLRCGVDLDRRFDAMDRRVRRGLEGVLDQASSFVVDGVLSEGACEAIITNCEALGFASFDFGKIDMEPCRFSCHRWLRTP